MSRWLRGGAARTRLLPRELGRASLLAVWVLLAGFGVLWLLERFSGGRVRSPAAGTALLAAGLLSLALLPGVCWFVVRTARERVERLKEEISARRAAEASLEQESRRLFSLLEALPAYVCVQAPDRSIPFVNKAFRDSFGEPDGRKCHEVMKRKQKPCSRCPTEEVFRTGRPAYGEWTSPDGRCYHTSYYPLVGPDGGSLVLEMGVDTTERNRVTAELQRAKRAAEEASRAKGEFVARVSHELRTPMNGVLGMMDLAMDASEEAQRAEYLALARSSAEALVRVINDILDFSRNEAGKIQVVSEPFNPLEVVKSALQAIGPGAEAKGVDLRWRAGARVPGTWVGDGGRIRQVLINLLGNAVKFTDRGRVALSVHLAPAEGAGGPCLRFAVRDSGPGIRSEESARLFVAFSQLDGSSTRRHGGTGLGLAISKQIVEAMGGAIRVVSSPGRGSIFSFSVPLPPSEQTRARVEARMPGPTAFEKPNLAVLLAEDHAVSRRLATILLERQGHAVAGVASGSEALAACERGRFDVILMDVQMPDMDGLEATRAIRLLEARGDGGRRTPIIGLTACALEGDRERCLAAGMDGYLTKPVRAPELRAAIADATAGVGFAALLGHGGGTSALGHPGVSP